MSDSVRPHRRQPTRLPHPWDSPGKNTGVGCHFLLLSDPQRLSHVQLSATPWTVACQAPLSKEFSRQEYWCRLPFPPPDPAIEPVALESSADSLHWSNRQAHITSLVQIYLFTRNVYLLTAFIQSSQSDLFFFVSLFLKYIDLQQHHGTHVPWCSCYTW